MKLLNAFWAHVRAMFEHPIKHERQSSPKNQTRYTYTDGPMLFLGQQIVREMQRMGYPAKIHCNYRSPEEQARLPSANTRAGPYQSPHQYFEAVDIIHPSKGWQVSAEYWRALADCAALVADKHNVVFDGGFNWGWDFAHIELDDWRDFKRVVGRRKPTRRELEERFHQVLPDVWKQHAKSQAYQRRARD